MKEELDLAGEDTRVFKLIGPALVNQDLAEAKGNVEKRIEYIRYHEYYESSCKLMHKTCHEVLLFFSLSVGS